ncbi:MAG: PilZ domain-containing protein [Rhodanobacteraceae bacterium]
MVEQRRFPRKRADAPIRVMDTMTEESIGRVGNLSVEGMLLLADRPVRDNALYQIRFALPDGKGGQRMIEAGVHEHWSEAAQIPGQSWVGFRFIDIGSADADALTAWLDDGKPAARR